MADDDPAPVPTTPGGSRPRPAAITAAGIIALAVLALAFLSMITLVVMAALGWLGHFPEDPMQRPSPYWPWGFFIWLALNGGLVAKLGGGFVAVVALGIKVIADRNDRVWPAVVILATCLVGFLLTLVLMYLISVPDTFRTLRGFADVTSDTFKTSAYATLGVLAVWFLFFAQRQVGLETQKELLSRTWKSLTGDDDDPP